MSMSLSGGAQTRAEQTQGKELRASVKASSDVACMGSLSDVQQTLAELEQRGVLECGVLAAEEILPRVEDAEEELDAEWDFADEDALPEDLGDSESVSAPSSPYRIRVVRLPDGSVTFDVPETGGEGWRVKTSDVRAARQAEAFLRQLTWRQRTFQAIADWLGQQDAKMFVSPESFLGAHVPMAQNVFEREHGIERGALSKYVQGACLDWGASSIPLRRLFRS